LDRNHRPVLNHGHGGAGAQGGKDGGKDEDTDAKKQGRQAHEHPFVLRQLAP
jgi:hypothetical protein